MWQGQLVAEIRSCLGTAHRSLRVQWLVCQVILRFWQGEARKWWTRGKLSLQTMCQHASTCINNMVMSKCCTSRTRDKDNFVFARKPFCAAFPWQNWGEITYNTAITACERGRQWLNALLIFDRNLDHWWLQKTGWGKGDTQASHVVASGCAGVWLLLPEASVPWSQRAKFQRSGLASTAAEELLAD